MKKSCWPTSFISIILLLTIFSYTFTQTIYFPERDANWEQKSPSEFNFNESIIHETVKFAESNEYSGSKDLRIAILEGFSHEPFHRIAGPTKKRGGPAGMILKNGYIIAQWGDVERVDMTFSVTKSYLSTLAGLAIDKALIKSEKEQVNKYVWDDTFKGAHNELITWEHLLNQSSDWYGQLFGMYDWADRPPTQGDIDAWRSRELYPPGSHYKYNDVRVNVLAYSLLHVYRQSLPQVLKNEVMDPMGASSTWRWFGYENSWIDIDGYKMQSVSGGGHSGGGVFINTLDHARFGLLYMNNGNWNDNQLISESWIDKLSKPSQANPSYGYLWWLNKGARKMEGVPEDVFYAAGFGGNYILVDQQNKIVIVTRWLEPSKFKDFLKLFYSSFDSK